MNIYYIVFLVTFLIQFIPVKNKGSYKWRSYLTFLPIFCYMSLRKDFGIDYPTYEEMFNQIHYYLDYEGREEIGYVLLNKIMPSWRIFLVSTTLFNCIAYANFFYRYVPSKTSWVAVLLFFLSGDYTIFFIFVGLRNGVTIIMLMLSVSLIYERRLIHYIIILIIAALFHQTALIYFPIAYVLAKNVSMKNKEFIIWIFTFIIFDIFSTSFIFDYLSSFINQYFDRYNSYIAYSSATGDNRGFLIIVSVIGLFIPMIYYHRKNNLQDSYNTIFRLSYLYAFSFILGSLNLRTSHYFVVFFIVSVSYMYANIRNIFYKNLYLIFVIVFLGYSFFKVFLNNPNFPFAVYHSILSS